MLYPERPNSLCLRSHRPPEGTTLLTRHLLSSKIFDVSPPARVSVSVPLQDPRHTAMVHILPARQGQVASSAFLLPITPEVFGVEVAEADDCAGRPRDRGDRTSVESLAVVLVELPPGTALPVLEPLVKDVAPTTGVGQMHPASLDDGRITTVNDSHRTEPPRPGHADNHGLQRVCLTLLPCAARCAMEREWDRHHLQLDKPALQRLMPRQLTSRDSVHGTPVRNRIQVSEQDEGFVRQVWPVFLKQFPDAIALAMLNAPHSLRAFFIGDAPKLRNGIRVALAFIQVNVQDLILKATEPVLLILEVAGLRVSPHVVGRFRDHKELNNICEFVQMHLQKFQFGTAAHPSNDVDDVCGRISQTSREDLRGPLWIIAPGRAQWRRLYRIWDWRPRLCLDERPEQLDDLLAHLFLCPPEGLRHLHTTKPTHDGC
mmetsp:Transcript_106714/g.299885  ORF Transcript_106714/g.299885 Transcript_106714/m.299885 type:complete len:430 (+) Transcript_106714:266-1555(+)